MLSIHQLLEVLGPHITGQWVRFLPEHSFTQLHVLDGQPVSQPRLLYLGTPDTFILAADRLIRKGCRPTFVLAGSSPALTAYQDREDLNLIATSLSLAALCNLLYEVSADDNLWYQSMSRHLYAQPDLPALLECGTKKLGGYACLLDAGCKLLCASPGPVPPAPLLERLEASTYLSLEDLNALRQTHDVSGQDWVPLEGGEAPWRVRLYSIQYKSQVVAHHLIALPDAACTPAARETASRFQKWVERFVLRYNHDKYESSNALSALLADLIEGRLTESEQLVGRLKQLPVHIKKYFHCIVVEPGSYRPRPHGPAHPGAGGDLPHLRHHHLQGGRGHPGLEAPALLRAHVRPRRLPAAAGALRRPGLHRQLYPVAELPAEHLPPDQGDPQIRQGLLSRPGAANLPL